MKKISFSPLLVLFLLVFSSCEKDRMAPLATADENLEWRANDCFTFTGDFDGCLGFVEFEIDGVTYQGFGAGPAWGYVGEYGGNWASIVLEQTPSGKSGGTHFTLIHKFTAEDGDYFYTDDKAVCAPAKGTGASCVINDQMTIVGGTGKFAGVTGKIKTHGPLTYGDPACLPNPASLKLQLRGHVCLNK